MQKSNEPNFRAWRRDTLDEFALEAFRRMLEQHDCIERMQRQIKDAEAENQRLRAMLADDWK